LTISFWGGIIPKARAFTSGPRDLGTSDACARGPSLRLKSGYAQDDTEPRPLTGRFRLMIFMRYPSADVGSITNLTSETLFAGNPPCRACSRTISSFGAM
jgi:hypothetical protein